MKLNQILAVYRGIKNAQHQVVTEAYQKLSKAPLFSGIVRTYKPLTEDGEKFPSETTQVQERARDLLKLFSKNKIPFLDVTLQRDTANCHAKADIKIGDQIIAKDIPVVTLLWLEKELSDFHAFIKDLPVLPSAENWTWSSNNGCYVSEPVETSKSKKIQKPVVKYEATKEHPAQVEMASEDVLTGYWSTVKFSGAIPRDEKQKLQERIEELMAAVKQARAEGNTSKVEERSLGKEIFAYLFEGVL